MALGLPEIPIDTRSSERQVLFPGEVTTADKQTQADVALGLAAISFLLGIIYLLGAIFNFYWFRFALIAIFALLAALQALSGSIANTIYAIFAVWFLYKMFVYRNNQEAPVNV